MTNPSSPSPDASVRVPFRRHPTIQPGTRRLLLALVVLFLAVAVMGWLFLTRPRLVFTNELAGPIRLVIGDDIPVTLAPGETIQKTLAGNHALVAQWELMRPLSADDRPMGSAVRGSVVLREPDGTMHRSAAARGPDADYFAPLITNGSEEQLRVLVNAGLEGSLDCGCAVRPGARRVFIGYYPLFQNSTVRARTKDGRTATFRDLGPSVTSRDGTVGLRFVASDLRR